MSRRLRTTLIVLGGLVILLVGAVALSLPSGSIETSEDGTQTIRLAMLSMPIAATEPLVENPDQFLGVAHPAPLFDTSALGDDLSFVQDTAQLAGLDPDEVLRAVYLGHDVYGDPYYVWHSGSPDLRQMLGQIVADLGVVGRLETSYGTEQAGPPLWEGEYRTHIEEHGLTSGSVSSISTSTESRTTLASEWHGLPSEVAVVVFYQEGEAVGWQRPVSGTAAFQFEYGSGQDPLTLDGLMVALTASGEEWERYEMFPG